MRVNKLLYIVLVSCFLPSFEGFGQDYTVNESGEITIAEEVNKFENTNFDESVAYEEFLNSDQSVTEMDRDKWEIIKRSIVEGISEDQYELVDSGGFVLSDTDNPYKRSRQSFKRYWSKKNSHRAKTRTKKEKEKEKEKKDRDKSNRSMYISPFFSSLLLILVVIGVAVVVYLLFFNAPIAKRVQKLPSDLSNIKPTEIPKTELELRLEKALAKKDFREAIRIYFIFIIRGLIIKDWIEWEKEKTNFSYLMEMRDRPLSKEFESTVSVYEIVWYGKREISEEEYKVLEPRFKELSNKLGQ